jgi:acyl transferase domain-containing protein
MARCDPHATITAQPTAPPAAWSVRRHDASHQPNRFDLHGTNCVSDAACASSLSALRNAVNELALGQADMVIAGGVDTMNDIFIVHVLYQDSGDHLTAA